MKLFFFYLFIFSIIISTGVLANVEDLRFICGGNEELKILCSGQAEQLYEIPEILNVSIIFPDGTDINIPNINLFVNMSKNLAICNYSLDGASNVSLGSVNYVFNKPITVSDGNHIIEVWCRDTFNLNNSYYDSVGFYVYTVTSPGGGGGEPRGIRLYSIKVFGESWVFMKDNIVNVHVFDMSDIFIDPDFVNISLVTNVTLNSESVLRIEEGKYRGIFNVLESNVSTIVLNISVGENHKLISELFEIEIETPSKIEEIKEYAMDKLRSFETLWQEYKLAIYTISILILLGLILYFVFSVYKKKEKED